MTKSHRNCGEKVYRPCSSCISSIGNLMGTPSSSPCQLGLGIVLRRLSLSSYSGIISYCFLGKNLVLCSIVSSICREVTVTSRRPSRVGILSLR